MLISFGGNHVQASDYAKSESFGCSEDYVVDRQPSLLRVIAFAYLSDSPCGTVQ